MVLEIRIFLLFDSEYRFLLLSLKDRLSLPRLAITHCLFHLA